MMTRQKTFLFFTAALMASGCDFTKFDDLEDKAPATRLEAGNGKPLLGFAKPDDAAGGILLMASTDGQGAIAQVRFDDKGGTRVGKTAADDYTDLNKLNLDGYYVRSFAPVWPNAGPDVSGGGAVGPLAFVGSTGGSSGKIQLIDTDSWREKTLIADQPTPDFGVALALARFSGTQDAQDLIVGAQGQVFLIDASAYPIYAATSLLGCTPTEGLASYVYTAVVAARSTPETVAAAAPAANFVTVMTGLESLAPFTDTTDCSGITFTKVPEPSGAQQFGAALLLDDLEGDLDLDLVVGAPEQAGGGAVYLYDTTVGYAAGQEIMIKAPEGAALFGASLALGTFDGVNRMLAVGAPGSNSDAGAIYLYKIADLSAGGSAIVPYSVVELDDGGNDKLGMGLAVVPLRQGTVTRDLLIGGAKSSALVFWANTTPDHKDYRTATP